jgi:hypothetical protein
MPKQRNAFLNTIEIQLFTMQAAVIRLGEVERPVSKDAI